uniref:helix-turn-helix domain-containing protein n=1 Tax=Streptomyces phaeochromogenes TaxID=1923 RepID=UPI003594444C
MRYAQGGGLTAERQRARERIRFEAGERFARGEKNAVIAKDLRVSGRSVERWRCVWRTGGMDALASSGPAKVPKLSDEHSPSWSGSWRGVRLRMAGRTSAGRWRGSGR